MGSELRSQPLRNGIRNLAEENSRVPCGLADLLLVFMECLGNGKCLWSVYAMENAGNTAGNFGRFLMFCILGESIPYIYIYH